MNPTFTWIYVVTLLCIVVVSIITVLNHQYGETLIQNIALAILAFGGTAESHATLVSSDSQVGLWMVIAGLVLWIIGTAARREGLRRRLTNFRKHK